MRRQDDTPPDTPAQQLLFALEAIGLALLMVVAAASAIVDWLAP
jgi:hypothetical protein